MVKVFGYCHCLQRNLGYEAYRRFFELQIEVGFWCRRGKGRRRHGGERNCDGSDKGFGEEGSWEYGGERRKGLGGF